MFPKSTGDKRKSYIEHGTIYFWTATINSWHHLLGADDYKDEIISSLRILSEQGKIQIFALAIMPNHIHLIWRIMDMNGKESPQGSLLKFTAHRFKKLIIEEKGHDALRAYAVERHNKSYEFWKRDSLAISLITRAVALQKLNYIHNNPLTDRWQLASCAEAYKHSSAMYYASGSDSFGFLHNLYEKFLMSQ